MTGHDIPESDYGTGQKKLGVYTAGLISCIILTLIAFWAVMAAPFAKHIIFATIYAAAIIQFVVQIMCFLRLNTQTKQGQINVMSIVFTLVILIVIIFGSLWIMWSLNYF